MGIGTDATRKSRVARAWPPLLRQADRVLSFLTSGIAATGTLLIFAVMILVNADIVLRATLNAPVIGVTEMVSQSIVAIAFLQLPHTLRVGRLTRADLLLSGLRLSKPTVALFLEAFFDLIGAIVFIVLAIGSWEPWIEAYREGFYVGAAGGFAFPVWPAKFIIFFGACLLVVQFSALVALKLARAIDGREAHV